MGRKPRCKICGQEVDKEKEQWFKNSVGYYHIQCRIEKNLPVTETDKCLAPSSVKEEFINRNTEVKTVKCYFCGLPAESATALRKESKAFHNDCYPEYYDRRELFKYCCNLWGLKAPGPLIARQAKDFRQKGYKYRGMMLSLKYFYEIKHNDKNKYKGSETIGIIPHVYKEAEEYYGNILRKQQELAKQAKEVTKQEVTVVKLKPIKKKPELYDFEQ